MAIAKLCMYHNACDYECMCFYCTPQFIACVELIHIDILQHHYSALYL